jgi:ADP-heptose:LPS heptosyltransferase
MRIAFDLKTAMGIGDAVCGLYAACGLADAGHSIVISTRHHAWLSGCKTAVGVGDFGDTRLDAAERYQEQLQAQRNASPTLNRSQWYINNIAAQRGAELAQIRPIVPQFEIPIEKPPVSGPYIVMNPFSAHTERVWRADKWTQLAELLVKEGITPVGIGAQRDARGLQAILGRVKGSHFYWNQSPQWIRSTMRQAIGFAGNDSGMTHVAASLRVPTVAVVAHLRPEFVFNPANVRGVTPDSAKWSCRFCGWQKPQGFRFSNPCLPQCSALQSIEVRTVFDAVMETCASNAVAA